MFVFLVNIREMFAYTMNTNVTIEQLAQYETSANTGTFANVWSIEHTLDMDILARVSRFVLNTIAIRLITLDLNVEYALLSLYRIRFQVLD